MPYKPSDEKTVGLVFERNTIQAAFVTSQKGMFTISRLLECPHLMEGVNLGLSDPEEKELKRLADTYLSVVGLSGDDLLVRRLRLKLTKDKDIEEAFLFQVEPLLPYPLENAIVDKLLVEKQEDTTLITFLSAKKEQIAQAVDIWQQKGIDPEVVTGAPTALSALVFCLSTTTPAQFAIHIGKESSLCALLREGKLLSSHVVTTGWETLYKALLEDKHDQPPPPAELFSIDFTNLDPALIKVKAALEAFQQAIQWNLLAQLKETKLKEPVSLFTFGEGANLQSLPSTLATALNLSLGSIRIPNNCSLSQLNTFALPIGYALSAQPEFPSAINFRRQELSYATPWKRFKKPLYLYAALSAFLALSLYIFGISYFYHQEDQLKSRYLTLLSLVQKPYEEFENQYETKYPPENREQGILPITALSINDLNARLDYLQKEIRSMPDTFPLLPNIPRVSDTLAWLSTHPAFKCPEDVKISEECPSFTIDTFSYSMVKRPELNKKNEKYQVKIDLEFETASPRLAREFHDALISPNNFVDPKGEIKWNTTKGRYRTSFYLKDKTSYPGPLKEF